MVNEKFTREVDTLHWILAYRKITRSNDERTTIATIFPPDGLGDSINSLYGLTALNASCLVTIFNCICLDYVTRIKLGGANLSFWILKQLPVLPPDRFSADDIAFIVPRVLELVYTAWDMRPFAEDVWRELAEPRTENQEPSVVILDSAALRDDILRRNAECNAEADPALFAPRDGFVLPPFRWDEGRRALIRAELDARIARLYGLTRDELRYILDPADVYGPDFPGETFRVLKEKETRLYGEYRTRRLVLEAWDRENGS
jgi:hypothetical protein